MGFPGLFFANMHRAKKRPEADPLKLYGPLDLGAVCDGAGALLQV